MKVERIKGEAQSKRERIAALPHRGYEGILQLVAWQEVDEIVRGPEYADAPDMIQVTMTEEQARWFMDTWAHNNPLRSDTNPAFELGLELRKILNEAEG